ncbi:hypothetical protein LEP1GSC081_1113 [Leptospira kirschneri str. H1]|uniref:Uncharacterized protein n=1 Tax=Leptospira kirschneri str. H1 TaxID=1049966 RepID=A0A0E2B5I6_9LEPT|nr:hypothetical protein LEP1GSC081_1113 [Leptospira kirschneri str. H1]
MGVPFLFPLEGCLRNLEKQEKVPTIHNGFFFRLHLSISNF